jgi:hypothetical protein
MVGKIEMETSGVQPDLDRGARTEGRIGTFKDRKANPREINFRHLPLTTHRPWTFLEAQNFKIYGLYSFRLLF